MESRYVLHYAPDNASLIIRLALEEMGLSYETALVDRSANGQRHADYLALNRAGKIPTLVTPHGPVSETGAILLYLADAHRQMAPSIDSPERPAFLQWLFFTANTLHADLVMLFYINRYAPEDTLPLVRPVTQERVASHLSLLDSFAANFAPEWLGGTNPSVLDCYVVAILRWCALYPKGRTGWYDLKRFPALLKLAERFETRPSVGAAIAAEGLGPRPITAPQHPNPPEGSAT